MRLIPSTILKYDDRCGQETHYSDQHDLVRMKIDPRGMLSDKWSLTSTHIPGFKYKFERNALNKGGKLIPPSTLKPITVWQLNLIMTRITGSIIQADSKRVVATLSSE